MKKSAIYTISLICLNTLLPFQAAIATGTSPLSAQCIWAGKEGEKVEQPCTVVGHSSAGRGVTFFIAWQDGYKTQFTSPPNSSGYATPSGTHVEIEGKYEHERILFPTYIQIQDQGIVTIQYADRRLLETLDFNWIEVPFGDSDLQKDSIEFAAISLHRVVDDVLIEFDLVDKQAVYARFAGNCQTSQLKMIRMGDFKSSNQVRYAALSGEWHKASGFNTDILNTACQSAFSR